MITICHTRVCLQILLLIFIFHSCCTHYVLNKKYQETQPFHYRWHDHDNTSLLITLKPKAPYNLTAYKAASLKDIYFQNLPWISQHLLEKNMEKQLHAAFTTVWYMQYVKLH